MENWARYYRARVEYKQCASLEGNYRSNWRQWVETWQIQHSCIIDWRDGELVERAWRGMIGHLKLLLKYHYMARNMPDYAIAKKAGVKRWQLPQEFPKAKRQIKNILDSMVQTDYKSRTI